MTFKIGFAGVPSSGKTTAAKHAYLTTPGNVVYVPEYARNHMERKGGRIDSLREQLMVQDHQGWLEDILLMDDPDVLITDSPVFLGQAYAKHYYPGENYLDFGLNSVHHPYDLLFWLEPLPYKPDGVRYQTPEDLDALETIIKELISVYHEDRPLITLPPGITEREKLIEDSISSWRKQYEQN